MNVYVVNSGLTFSVDLHTCTLHTYRMYDSVYVLLGAFIADSLLQAGQKTLARPPVRDEYSCISDEWVSESTCPMGRVARKKDVPTCFGLC